MFSKILIANRGEIALRIIRACHEMGIRAVQIYSEADADSLPVALADESICVGRAPASESYLNMKNIISAAVLSGAQAIHPGYGFLSENATFAELCEQNDIAFIGPSAEVIRNMGDKDNARRLMKSVGVPTVPGTDILGPDDDAAAAAREIGYPVIVKASAGGGGKGIRIAWDASALEESIRAASAEAKSAFGNGDVFIEKYLTGVRHVEMQIIADKTGKIICLGERDCSLQRHNQKVLEESPCPVMSEEVRRRMEEAAVKAATAAEYTNAGTVEFLLDSHGDIYFIEMNTRLQVEHPVTEETSGIDIVKWQIRIASGVELSFSQDEIETRGCALECRINALKAGEVTFYHAPGGSRVRFESALTERTDVTPFYDSMIGKLIVFSMTREEAVRKMETALCEIAIEGVETNVSDQLTLIRSDRFKSGDYDTSYLKELDASTAKNTKG